MPVECVMNSFFFSLATFCTARPTADTGTSTIRSTWSTSYQRRAMPPPMSGLSWWSPTMMLIGLPSTLPPKSSIAICAAVTEPWPVGVDAGPFMSVSTPILTTSSETCASAAVDASIAAASIPSMDRFLANILSSPPWNRRVGRWFSQAVCSANWSHLQLFCARRQRGRMEEADSERYPVLFISGPIQGIAEP